jgi:hypothetical protein
MQKEKSETVAEIFIVPSVATHGGSGWGGEGPYYLLFNFKMG